MPIRLRAERRVPVEFCIEHVYSYRILDRRSCILQDYVRLRNFVWKDAETVRFFAHPRTHVRLCDYVHL